jgi:probable phosphoglycerate mutase
VAARNSTVFLIRHGHTDAVGTRLTGRLPGVHLTAAGREQAVRLPARLRRHTERLAAVYTSPLERTRETADPIAEAFGVTAQPCDALLEPDFGHWTGSRFEDLDSDPAWRLFNAHRSRARVPGGESALAVQARIISALDEITSRYADGAAVAVVSHADVIRAALLAFLGMPLDLHDRLVIEPASMSGVQLFTGGLHVLFVNDVDRGM